MYGGASEGDALRQLMRRVHATSAWVHLSPAAGLTVHPSVTTRSFSAGQMVWSLSSLQRESREMIQSTPWFLSPDFRWRLISQMNEGTKWEGEFIGTGNPLRGTQQGFYWGSNRRDLKYSGNMFRIKTSFPQSHIHISCDAMLYAPRKILFSISWGIFVVWDHLVFKPTSFKEIKCIFSIFEPNVWPLGNAAKERITNTRKAL